ncbi:MULTISPECIES: hypothetical protein [unclassified Streptomyces]|nr:MULTISPECIES: hypothetical protein [unclassified Streptomyces]MCX5050268.1 hypothetical protein [Streptomyces sp. NBC_00474]
MTIVSPKRKVWVRTVCAPLYWKVAAAATDWSPAEGAGSAVAEV